MSESWPGTPMRAAVNGPRSVHTGHAGSSPGLSICADPNVAEDPMTNGVPFPPVCPPKNPDVPPVVNTPPRIFSPCQNGR